MGLAEVPETVKAHAGMVSSCCCPYTGQPGVPVGMADGQNDKVYGCAAAVLLLFFLLLLPAPRVILVSSHTQKYVHICKLRIKTARTPYC